MIGWVTRNVISREKSVMINIYKSLIRPHLEYCVSIWNPTLQFGNCKVIMDIENLQRRYTRLIDGIGLLSYKERLQEVGLTTLLERRMRGDIIETYKIFRGLVNYGNNLFKFSRSGYNILKCGKKSDFLPNRVANYWNKLPDSVKDAESTDIFKSRLQKFKVQNQHFPGNYW